MKEHSKSGAWPKLFSGSLLLFSLLVFASSPAMSQVLKVKERMSLTSARSSLSYLHDADGVAPLDTKTDARPAAEAGRLPVEASPAPAPKGEGETVAPDAGSSTTPVAATTTSPATTVEPAPAAGGEANTSTKMSATTTAAATTAAVVQTAVAQCSRTITANVVALDQLYTYNRLGAFNPAGMMYALRRDVVMIDSTKGLVPGNVRLRADKRPRPLVLRANEGDCLTVNFTNLLTPAREQIESLTPASTQQRQIYFDKPPFFIPKEGTTSYDLSQNKLRTLANGTVQVVDEDGQVVADGQVRMHSEDSTMTRAASMHVNGLEYVNSISADGSNVGNNPSSLALPGETKSYQWYAKAQGQYFMYSMGTVAGGEGDGGQIDLGLFGSVNVEPRGAKWYRSQVTGAQLKLVTKATNPNGTPQIDYAKLDASGTPVLNMLNASNEIIYTDLNAIIDMSAAVKTATTENCGTAPPTGTCGQSFREFTVVFHDETKTVQAFPELNQELFHGVRDGFAINYGSAGLGAEVLANRKKVGPAANCPDCAFEEFFLESWANGDPAMNVRKDATGKAVEALFPDDPSNVHHSYMGDPVRFRNLHAGPKETHVFHLHAHQWLHESREDGSTYLDSQTIGPGGAFTYEINYGGSGNRNLTVGDSIFHCHLYPHFAQGMWELWRSHDVFEAGTADRNLPDAEIAGGTPNPAIVPIPNRVMPPMPSATFKGYPFYVAAQTGHRAPQPPLDMDFDGGLPRHRVISATRVEGPAAIPAALLNDPVTARVLSLNKDPNLLAFADKMTSAKLEILPQDGTADEKTAMQYHQGLLTGGKAAVNPSTGWPGAAYPSYTSAGVAGSFFVNGRAPKPGAPYADPCPDNFTDGAGNLRAVPNRNYRAAYIQFDMTVNKAGWHDRQARIEVLEQDVIPTLNGTRAPEPFFFRANSGDCITFKATNLVPKALNLDDFQIYTPTDIIGQHIHLVKFDVTSSDGAGNGWNYEDGTFAPDAVRERIEANNAYQKSIGGTQILTAKTHPAFGAGPNSEWVGAQTTIQRWWADPLMNQAGEDRTIRTVFTHDHFGPSSHQHHGLYGALVVEPTDSQWQAFDGSLLGNRADGGPTSFKANIIFDTPYTYDQSPSFREFNLAFADFAIVYTPELKPVNPPGRKEVGLPAIVAPPDIPQPESISADDPGTSLINYRNEPIPLRIRDKNTNALYPDARGNMANVFRSQDDKGAIIHGDPFTPILEGYEGDNIHVRLIQGSQEEQHVFNLHGGKWLHEPSVADSGYYNAQAIGISEHFEFELPPMPAVGNKFGANPTAADFLYSSGGTDNLWDGMWGIMREYRGTRPGLAVLPANVSGSVSSSDPGLRTDFCPSGSPKKDFLVEARLATDLAGASGITYNKKFGLTDPAGIVFVQTSDIAAIKAGTKKLEPLMLRANAGDCINVTLTNNLPVTLPDYAAWNFMPMIVENFNLNNVKSSNEVSLHPQLLEYDVRTSDGANVGINDKQTVAPGGKYTYRWYAGRVDVQPDGSRQATPIEYGAVNLTDYGDIMKHASHGAVGMIVIEPKGATWTTPSNTNAEANVSNSAGAFLFKEFNVVYQDDLNMKAPNGNPVRNYVGEEDSEDSGMKGFNYKTEPIWARLGFTAEMSKIDPATFQHVDELLNDVDQANVLSSATNGDPETPIFSVTAGTQVRFRVVEPNGHPRQHAFAVFGHSWHHEAWTNNSTMQWNPSVDPEPASMTLGAQGGHTARRHWNIILPSAGGGFKVPGDYLYRTQESYHFTSGLWGIFRVTPAKTVTCMACSQDPPTTQPVVTAQ